jgi:formylglycine-generating enzyme required for sulfatase activity
MGSEANEDEMPVHRVTISKGFYLGVYPVTQTQWRGAMGNDNRPSAFTGDDFPVTRVTWHDCQVFCARLRELAGKPVRLPSEAEWEYACRAGTTTDYYSGNGEEALERVGWYKDNSGSQIKPVGQLAANAFGLFDMHGNVWEWCEDWYGDYSGDEQTDPIGATDGEGRVLRGGSFGDSPGLCFTGFRYYIGPADRQNNCGLRVCFHLD